MTKQTFSNTFFAMAILTTPALGAAPVLESTESILTIRLYNYADVNSETLAEAGESARRIYSAACVETRWIECRTQPDQPIFNPSCQEAPGPGMIRMRIMPTVSEKLTQVGGSVYGFALPSKSGGFGGAATIFWDRVANSAAVSKVTDADLLGCVMAHEAGHLILGFDSHSAMGLMSAQWTNSEFQKIAEGAFVFIGREKKKIQRGTAARLAASL